MARWAEPEKYLHWYEGPIYYSISRQRLRVTIIGWHLICRISWMFWLWLKHPIRFFDAAHRADYWRTKHWDAHRRNRDLQAAVKYLSARIRAYEPKFDEENIWAATGVDISKSMDEVSSS